MRTRSLQRTVRMGLAEERGNTKKLPSSVEFPYDIPGTKNLRAKPSHLVAR